VDVKVTLLHQVRNWATVILGNIEMGNLEKALLATEHLKGNIRTCELLAGQSCEEGNQSSNVLTMGKCV
jgi:allantoicase